MTKKRELATVGDRLAWAYAELGKAHAAVDQGAAKYNRLHFMIRAKLYKGLRSGSMSRRSLMDDERLKMTMPQCCGYCGAQHFLSLDHLVPVSKGGPDTGDNVVWACRSCNSSKGARDLLEWYAKRGEIPPLLLLRRYLKIAYEWFDARELLAEAPDAEPVRLSPFAVDLLLLDIPGPSGLALWVTPASVDRR
jgi:hypothetical protein